jgi:hypothetical protein
MNRDDLRALLCDYLDGLLDGDEKRAAEEEVARSPGALADAARLRAALYRPYRVDPPPPDQEERILRRFGERPARRWLRYAAIFVAGALTTLLVQAGARPSAGPGFAPAAEEAPPPSAEALTFNRRIR